MRWLQSRTTELELIDSDSLTDAERLEAIDQLPRVNRWLGGVRAVLKELPTVCERLARGRRLRVLDVGCGVGDIPQAIVRWAGVRGRAASVVAFDRDRATLDLAARRIPSDSQIVLLRGNGLRLPFVDRSFDVVTASMFCHHFFGPDLVQLLREMTRVAGEVVIVNDLHRHWAALWGYRLYSRLFLRGHVIRHDGAVSVRRGFLPSDLCQLASHCPDFCWTVRRRFAFRLCLVGRRKRS